MKRIFVLIFMLCIITYADFIDINAGLQEIEYGCVRWGDYDNDGDEDILVSGYSDPDYITKIYNNSSCVFTDINAGIENFIALEAEWGDYDNDGDLDLVMSGYTPTSVITRIYRNDSTTFTDINADIISLYYSSLDWGDYDNDNDLDLIICGYSDSLSTVFTKIYRNDNNVFTDAAVTLPPVFEGTVDWVDYDLDGDLDVFISGMDDSYSLFTDIFRNDSLTFSAVNAGFTGFLSVHPTGEITIMTVILTWLLSDRLQADIKVLFTGMIQDHFQILTQILWLIHGMSI